VSGSLDQLIRQHWWAAVATLCRLTGDLDAAEDAVQDACVAALERWPATGVPDNALGWLIGVARHKAVDRMRREAIRGAKEAASMREIDDTGPGQDTSAEPADPLSLMFLCCHPALDASARVALTLRSVCGLSTAEIAAAFLVPEETMAKRLVRAKAKIRDARIPFRVPGPAELPGRLGGVLRVIYVLFTEGHMASRGEALVRGDLCDTAISLARGVAGLLPGEPEAMGLLALLLLTDARRAARTDDLGDLVLLEDQDRGRWDRDLIAEGEAVLETALRRGRPGPYQLHAAIAACHSTAASADQTDWRQIALLYGELIRYEPTPLGPAAHRPGRTAETSRARRRRRGRLPRGARPRAGTGVPVVHRPAHAGDHPRLRLTAQAGYEALGLSAGMPRSTGAAPAGAGVAVAAAQASPARVRRRDSGSASDSR
jgi:RNA polymerase sigma-70 factor (ECF subfamily)